MRQRDSTANLVCRPAETITKPGDVVHATIASGDGAIALGEQRHVEGAKA